MYTVYTFLSVFISNPALGENIVFLPERWWPVFTFSYPNDIRRHTDELPQSLSDSKKFF